MTTIKRVDIMSAAKMMGVSYAMLGVLIGAIMSIISVGALLLVGQGGSDGGVMGVVMGLGAIIFFPLFYGIMGFIGGLISGLVYNLSAKIGGGIKIEIENS